MNYDGNRATSLNERAIEILEEVANKLRKKNEDYTGGSVTDDMYFDLPGVKEAPNATLMWTKMLRYVSTYESGSNFDNCQDCLIDLIGYAARASARLDAETDGKQVEHILDTANWNQAELNKWVNEHTIEEDDYFKRGTDN